MKKKIVSICLVAVIAVMAIAGASLAYLTDTDDATNTFTVGNVKIQLVEQQRDGEGSLEDFEQNKNLMPIVGSAQGAKDKFGLSTAKNYVDKIVNVKNTGKSDAYVRVLVAIPTALQSQDGNAGNNVLHWNTGNKFTAKGDYNTTVNPQPVNPNYAEKCVFKDEGTATIGGISYDICSFTYTDALAAGKTTEYASFVGFYLDKNVDTRFDETTQKLVYTINGVDIDFDFSNGVTIPVYAQAIQAAGFDTAEEAFANAGLPTNPWAE